MEFNILGLSNLKKISLRDFPKNRRGSTYQNLKHWHYDFKSMPVFNHTVAWSLFFRLSMIYWQECSVSKGNYAIKQKVS